MTTPAAPETLPIPVWGAVAPQLLLRRLRGSRIYVGADVRGQPRLRPVTVPAMNRVWSQLYVGEQVYVYR